MVVNGIGTGMHSIMVCKVVSLSVLANGTCGILHRLSPQIVLTSLITGNLLCNFFPDSLLVALVSWPLGPECTLDRSAVVVHKESGLSSVLVINGCLSGFRLVQFASDLQLILVHLKVEWFGSRAFHCVKQEGI